MANQWFKFFGGEFIADPKIISLPAHERSLWITLMCLASMGSGDGQIGAIPEHTLMLHAGFDETLLKRSEGLLKRFEKLGMITLCNGMITLNNWQKRQATYSKSYERLKKWREKKRSETLSRNENETGKKRIEENRIEEKKNKKRKNAAVAAASPSKPSKKDPEELMSLEEFVSSMRTSPHRHVRLIGEYADEIKPDMKTRGQWTVFIGRNVRSAKKLEVFSDEQISAAMSRIEKDCRTKNNPKGFITDWTLETLLKYITK